MNRWARLRGPLGLALVAASVAFLLRQVVKDLEAVAAASWQFSPGLLGLSILVQAAVLVAGSALWQRTLLCLGVPPLPFVRLLRTWSLSQAARYVPGTVWQFLAAAELGADVGAGHGVARATWVASVLVHVAFSTLGACVVAFLPAWPSLVAAGVVVLLVHPAWINRCLGWWARLSRTTALTWGAGWWVAVQQVLAGAASWVVSGVALAAMFHAVLGEGAPGVVQVVRAHAGAFVTGQLVVPAPGGLGVREAVMALLLQGGLGTGVASVGAALGRLWSVVAEVLVMAVALVASRRHGS